MDSLLTSRIYLQKSIPINNIALLNLEMPNINTLGLKLIVIIILCAVSVNILAQNTLLVSGTINDSTGKPIIGAAIQIKGTTVGTITDTDGIFTIRADKNATLVLSSIGYKTIELIVNLL